MSSRVLRNMAAAPLPPLTRGGLGWGRFKNPLPASPLPGGGEKTLNAHKNGLMQQLFPAVDDDCRDAITKGWSMDSVRATQDAKAEVQP